MVRTVEHGLVIQAIPLSALRALYPITERSITDEALLEAARGEGDPALGAGSLPAADPSEYARARARAASLAAKLGERSRELERVRGQRDAALEELRALTLALERRHPSAVAALAARARSELAQAREMLAEAGEVLAAVRAGAGRVD